MTEIKLHFQEDEFKCRGSKGYNIHGDLNYNEDNMSFRYKTIMNRIVHWYDYKRQKCINCLDFISDENKCKKEIKQEDFNKACRHFVLCGEAEEIQYNEMKRFYKMSHMGDSTKWHFKVGNMMFKKSISLLLKEKESIHNTLKI